MFKKIIIGILTTVTTATAHLGYPVNFPNEIKTLPRIEARQGEMEVKLEQVELPTKVREITEGVQIFLTKNNIEEMKQFKKLFKVEKGEYYSLGAVAIYDSKSRTIYVESEYKNSIKANLMHELAHDIDRENTGYSDSEEFKAIYEEESTKLFNTEVFTIWTEEGLNYYTDYITEYFAETFAMMDNYRVDMLKEYAPKTYGYMKENFYD